MLGLLTVTIVAALVVAFALPRHAAFSRHLGLGALVGAIGLPVAMVFTALLFGAGITTGALFTLAIVALYGAILGAAGGSIVWVLGRLSLVTALFTGRSGLDPEGDNMRRDVVEARRREALRRAGKQVEEELAAGSWDADLWEQAGDEVGRQRERQRQRYAELRADRIVHG